MTGIRILDRAVCIAALLVLGLTAFAEPQAPAWTATEHQLLRDGRPFSWLGDTGWLLMRLGPEDVTHYLDDRAAKRFTVIQMMAIRTDHSQTSPTYGDELRQTDDPGRRFPAPGVVPSPNRQPRG